MSQATGPQAPQAPFDFSSLTASVITKTVSDAIAKSKALEDQVAALKAADCTFNSVVLPLALDEGDIDVRTDSATFMQSVSPDKSSRDAATESQKQLSDYSIASSMRQDIFDALQHAQKNTLDSSLDPESQRLLNRMLLDKRRAGLGLSAEKQARYKALKQEINAKCIEFRKNCDEEAGFLTFTKDELVGVPESVMKGYEQVEDNNVVRYKVTNKTPDIVPVMRYCQVPSTRRRSYINYENRNANNTHLFSEIIDLRREAADVMNYPTHADYVIEPKMAKTANTVNDFLDDLHSKISTVGEKERDRLLELKKRDEEKLGLEHDPLFNAYDYRYLDRLYVEETLSLDDEEVKQYLPVEQVVRKTLALYEDLLGVQCFQSKDAPVWHPDVTAFSVWDRAALTSSSNQHDAFQGWLYLDLFPRPGKYGHAAVFTLQPGFEKADGSRSYPVCSMVANLAKPVAGQPALLSHYDFVTFFHEMGHAYHCLLSRTKYARFAGTRVARDFVEAPSQMLENWCFTPKVLKMVSKHHATGEPMPDDLIDKIVRSDAINKGLFNLRQLFFGKFDMAVHTSDKAADYTKLWNDLREKIALTKLETDSLPEGQGSFAHLVGGYDAGYYGYLYSQSFSADMFETVFAKDPLSTESGSLYRDQILLPGGSRDEMDSLVAFLGRRPNNSAFLRKLLAGAST